MGIEIERQGHYEIFKTTADHRILVLDRDDYFAWVETSQGQLLVKSDSDHRKDRTLDQGDYILFTPQDEPGLRDNMSHLELQEGQGRFHTYILPQGLPDSRDTRNKIIDTEEYLREDKIKTLLRR